MERFMRGDIIVTPFPFSDFSSSIKRPALVLADSLGDDLIICQITTRERKDKFQIELDEKSLVSGNLKVRSFIRPSKILSIRKSIVLYKIGSLKRFKLKQVFNSLKKIFKI